MSSSFETAANYVPLRNVMAQLTAELKFLVRATATVEAAIARIVVDAPTHPPHVLRDLQNLDLLTQSLAALAGYTNELTSHLPEELAVDSGSAAHVVTLAALARRLRIASIDPEIDVKNDLPMELFG